MKRIWIIAGVVIIAAAATWYFVKHRPAKAVANPYEFTTIKQGNLQNTVSATGTMEAVGTVDVSTQVSGTIDKVLADYNDVVKKGQVLAIIDQQSLRASYIEQQSNYQQAQANLRLAQNDYDTQKAYHDKGLNTDYELLQADIALDKAKASLAIAKSGLDKADLNLNTYSIIRSPIDGKVLTRDVEAGSTVQASMSAPTLFTIARTLTDMEIHANVDESDIGQIKKGQQVTYTVEAYPDSTFKGVVKDFYMQGEVVSNVVNYTVVITTKNPGEILLPGMTATVEFIVSEVDNVQYVENAALNVTMTKEMQTELQKNQKAVGKDAQRQMDRVSKTNSKNDRPGPPEMGGGSSSSSSNTKNAVKLLYYLDSSNALHVAAVKTGVTDGTSTEITFLGQSIPDGAKIIRKATGTAITNGPHMPKLL